jgi:hypothetical protein
MVLWSCHYYLQLAIEAFEVDASRFVVSLSHSRPEG